MACSSQTLRYTVIVPWTILYISTRRTILFTARLLYHKVFESYKPFNGQGGSRLLLLTVHQLYQHGKKIICWPFMPLIVRHPNFVLLHFVSESSGTGGRLSGREGDPQSTLCPHHHPRLRSPLPLKKFPQSVLIFLPKPDNLGTITYYIWRVAFSKSCVPPCTI